MKETTFEENIQEAVVDYLSGHLTQERALQLLNWIDSSEENRQCFAGLCSAWHRSGQALGGSFDLHAAAFRIKESIKERDIRKLPGKYIHIRLSKLIRIAAAVILLLAAGSSIPYLFGKLKAFSNENTVYEAYTPKGSRSSITMPDGTLVWMNADTRIRYSATYGQTDRDVFLEGEAYFRVEKNKNLPFRVTTSDLCITALGTSFNVKSYSDESTIETTLEEGRLQIETLGQASSMKIPEPVTLEANQNAIYVKNSGDYEILKRQMNDIQEVGEIDNNIKQVIAVSEMSPIIVNEVVSTETYTSWKDSRWIIKNQRLSELVPKLERRYDVSIALMDEDLGDYAITATLLEESLEQVLQAIRYTAPIRFEVNSKNVYLYEDPELVKKYEEILNP